MKKPIKLKAKSAQQGIVLLEALIAILLFSMGVLALVGLQTAMMKNTEDAKIRSEASYLAQQKIGEIWANPNPLNFDTYRKTDEPISGVPNGVLNVEIETSASGVSEVTVNIDWQQPGKDPHHFTTVANIAGS